LKNKEVFLSSLIKEINLRKDYLSDGIVETIYFGGGTPSLLTTDDINRIYYKIQNSFHLAEAPEITIEANPESIDREYLRQLKNTGVNRLSIGIQSFFDDDLKYLDRIHNAHQAESSIESAIAAGFDNISIDLIYSISTSTDEKLIENLKKIKTYGIDHFSAYSLTIEPETILARQINKGIRRSNDEEMSLRQFEIVMDFAIKNDYEHYEISNFCRNGRYSMHNTSYWKGIHYLGLGPSAHSYNGNTRQWNIANISKYINCVENSTNVFEMEELTTNQKYNEYILTSLRTSWGCNIETINKHFGKSYMIDFEKLSLKHIENGLLSCEKGVYYLTRKGKFLADYITSDFFV
jgi:oxygen-independent coproporphyrinogen-3 oxidase